MIADRIKELRRVRAGDILANPSNYRTHPDEQKDVMQDVLERIGFAGALLARELDDGTLVLIDGHLRGLLGGESMTEYGRCPTCGKHGVSRERRLCGNDICEDGHVYPSANSIEDDDTPSMTSELSDEQLIYYLRDHADDARTGWKHQDETEISPQCVMERAAKRIESMKTDIELYRVFARAGRVPGEVDSQ